MDVKSLGGAPPVLVPYVLEDLLPGVDDVRVTRQVDQKIVLLRRQRDGSAVVTHVPGPGVDLEKSHLDTGVGLCLRLVAAGPSQNGSDPRHELTEPKRFHYVVVGAEFEQDHAVDLISAGGDHDDRHVGPFAQLPADDSPVEVWKTEVEQHEITLVGSERSGPGVDQIDLETFAQQTCAQRLGNRGIVLYNQ